MKKIGFIMVMMLASLLAISPSIFGAETKGPIKIGVLMPFSGGSALHGEYHKHGIELFLKQNNYTIAGRKVETYYEDTEGKPDVALAKAKRLATINNVHMMMGLVMTNVGYALKPYVDSIKMPLLISAFVGADDLTHPPVSPYIYRNTYSPMQTCSTTAHWAYHDQGIRRVALLSLDYGGGIEMSGAFARCFKHFGGKIIQEMYAPFGTGDWSPYLAKLDKSADALFGLIIGGAAVKFIRQFSEFGLYGKMKSMIYGFDANIIEETFEAGVGNVETQPWGRLDTPEWKAFEKAVYDAYDERPYTSTDGAYTSIVMIAAALKDVQGDIENKEKFLEALGKVQINAPRGPVRFDKYHHAIQNFYIRQVQEKPWRQYRYDYVVVKKYENVDQFWPFTAEEYLAMPKLTEMKGKMVD